MQPLLDTIKLSADQSSDSILSGLKSYIAQGANGENAVQAYFIDNAKALGCEITTYDYNPLDVTMKEEFAGDEAIDPHMRRSVIAHYKGTGGGRSLILFAHPDSEEVKHTEQWNCDPFAGEIKDGRIYGWGVADDLSGIAAGPQALSLLLECEIKPKGDIYIVNSPSKRHARGVAKLLQDGLQADAAVYLHPAESGVGMKEIKAFTSGQVEFRVVIKGQKPPTTEPLQTAFAHQGVNAIDKAFIIWDALKALDAERAQRVFHPSLNAQVGRSTNLMMSYIASGQASRLARLADECTLGAALAFPPPEKLSEACAEVEKAVAAAAASDEWLKNNPPRIIWDSGVTGAEVSPEHDLVLAAQDAVSCVTNVQPWINPMHTGSDIRNPNVQRGIPTIGLGPLCGDLSQNNGNNEWVDAADHVRFVAAIAGIIANWCSTAEN
jgi:acetylornithine deacetylase